MENVKAKINAGVLTIGMSGHIDSSNAAEVQEEVTKLISENPAESIVIDAEGLKYISSAGLRILLKVRKEHPELKVINTDSEVYEILDMTGFTEMITVEKAYRRVSLEGCEVIGRGANGEVYRIDPETIVKVYHNPDSLPDIMRERKLARRAFVLGIPTAISYDVCRVGDGYGSVFELLNAKPLSKLIIEEPENLEKYIKNYTALLKHIHSTETDDSEVPDIKDAVRTWAEFTSTRLSPEEGEKLIGLINAVPDVNNMIHGDFHIKNVMIQNGEMLLIDMDTLAHGHPIFELASIYLAYLGFSEFDHENIKQFLGISRETGEKIWKIFISEYFETEDEKFCEEITNKAALIGFTRLVRRESRRGGSSEESKTKYGLYLNRVSELLKKVSSLEF